MAITFHSDVRFTCIIYRDTRNWTQKLSASSNGHNFWLECMIDAHNISRRSKLNNRSSREIQMAITFHSDVRFTYIIYRDHQNGTLKLLGNSNGHNFLVVCMIDADYISRLSKLNNRSSQEIQMVITFPSNIWFMRIMYRDTRNWTRRLSANSNGLNFWIGCMIEAHDVWRRMKLNNESTQEIQMIINFIQMYDLGE